MKSSEFITESISDIPPDVISRLGKLLIKPLRDRFEYELSHPKFYSLTDLFDEIFANKTYAKSPRRDQVIELLFPYVVQNLDEIIKATKVEGYEFPFPLILKLFKRDVDNDAVAEVVDHNKDKLLAILNALIEKTSKSDGRSIKDLVILEIIRTLKNNFIDWPELDVLYKQHFTTRYNTMLNAHKDKWGTDNVYNVLRDMTENKLALNDLDPALVSRLQGMKDSLLNRHFLNFKWDSISYSLGSIKDWYRMLKKVGFTWPELSNFETMTPEQQIIRLKTPIIKELLKLFKNNDTVSAGKVLAELQKSGIHWPELSVMTTSLDNSKSIAEADNNQDLLSRMSNAVKSKFAKGDYADALRYMGDYGLTYAAAPGELQELIDSRRMQIIKDLIDIARHNPDAWRVYRLMSFVKLVELGWPEIDTLFNSAKAAKEDDDRI